MGIDVQPGEIVTPVVLEGRIASPLGLVDHAPRPDQIAGLQLWLRADSLGLSDGDSVSTWRDESGQGNDATQGTAAAQPTFKTGVVNGKPVVRFDGLDDALSTGSLTAVSQPYEIIVVYQFQILTDSTHETVWDTPSSFVLYRTDNGAPGSRELYAGASLKGSTENLDAHIVRAHYGGANSFADVDSVQDISGDVGPNDWDGMVLGAQSGPTKFANVDVSEAMVYNRLLSSAEADQIESYLNAKYSIF